LRIIRRYAGLPPEARGAAIAIGNFDGVHRGHRAVIEATAARAREAGVPLGVLTFEPHPRSVLGRAPEPFRLTPFRVKAVALAGLGVERLYVLRFNGALAAKPAEAFVRDVLIEGLGAHHLVVGEDFAFGKGRTGTAAMLKSIAASHGVGATLIAPQGSGAGRFSSSEARGMIAAGDMAKAAAILGRWFELEGHIVTGDRRGRTIGFPTANLPLRNVLHPASGVYGLFAGVPSANGVVWHEAVGNLGRRPTFNGTEERLEVHLFDFRGDLYGRRVCFRFVERIRPERKFDGLDALKAQIELDCRSSRAILARERADGPNLGRAANELERAST